MQIMFISLFLVFRYCPVGHSHKKVKIQNKTQIPIGDSTGTNTVPVTLPPSPLQYRYLQCSRK